MRADLDGFTRRVEEGFADIHNLTALASGFYTIMDAAARFTSLHNEMLVQLPWAGDNFTAAAVFPSKERYDAAVPKRLVELSLDFDKEMGDIAKACGFGGWAHGVAGGEVHGNANGNVYLGAVELEARRFLVGAGEGVGRSAQAFGDINPAAEDLVLYWPDWERLDGGYKGSFERAVTHRGEQSSLYRKASMPSLVRVRAKLASAPATSRTIVTFSDAPRAVSGRPYHA